MKIPPSNQGAKSKFYDTMLAELSKVPFGTYTKKDLECLMLHAFFEAGIVKTRKTRELANLLELNEQRVKSVLLDIRYKFQPDSMAANIDKVISEVLLAKPSKLVHENGNFVFALEDPVLKLDFEQAMKDLGYYSDTSFNKEIVKVRDFALVAFLFRRNNNDNTFADLQAMIKASRATEGDLLAAIRLEKSWLEIGKDMLNLAKEGYDKVELVMKLARFFTTGSFA